MNEPLADKLPLRDLPINVGGEWRRGRGHAYQSLYPADLCVSAELHAASAEDALRIYFARNAHGRAPKAGESLRKLSAAYDEIAAEVGLTSAENLDAVEVEA